MKFVWLLESMRGFNTVYWAGYRPYTLNPWDALFFADERSAKLMSKYLNNADSSDWKATEHGFDTKEEE
jgi:hypothetical protein